VRQEEALRDGNHCSDKNHRYQENAPPINCELDGERQVSKEKENATDRINAKSAFHQKDVPDRGKQKVAVNRGWPERAGASSSQAMARLPI
jgi:hypothetical protein